MFCTHYAFLPAFLRSVQNLWKANAGIFFLVYSAYMNFFNFIFPCMNFFVLRPHPPPPPPHNFSNGPSLSVHQTIDSLGLALFQEFDKENIYTVRDGKLKIDYCPVMLLPSRFCFKIKCDVSAKVITNLY